MQTRRTFLANVAGITAFIGSGSLAIYGKERF